MLEEQQGKMEIQNRVEINCESHESEGETKVETYQKEGPDVGDLV